MTQLVYTAAGAVIGYVVSGGNPYGAQVGAAIGGGIGAIQAAPDIQGPRLSDSSTQISSYGASIPRVWGGDRLAGNVIWAAPRVETASESSAKGGPTLTEYSYTRSFAVLVADGYVESIRRIWAYGKLVYDASDASNIDALSMSSAFRQYWTFYQGTEDQLPSPVIEAIEGVGNVEAYRGSAYIVFDSLPIDEYGGNIPQLTFEVSNQPEQAIGEGYAYEPLVVYDWIFKKEDRRPIHPVVGVDGVVSESALHRRVTEAPLSDYSSFSEAAAAQAAAFSSNAVHYERTAASSATDYCGFFYTDFQATPGAAGLDPDLQYVYPLTAAYGADLGPYADTTYHFDVPTSQDALIYPKAANSWDANVMLYGLRHNGSSNPPSGYAFTPYSQYAYSGSDLLTFWATYVLTLRSTPVATHDGLSAYPGDPSSTVQVDGYFLSAKRSGWKAQLPSNADYCIDRYGEITPNYTWEIITGTAKQLCAVEYRDGRLYQQALGPVLLPSDGAYDNADYWTERRNEAVLAGLMATDVAYPVEVTSYARGTRVAAYYVPAGSTTLSTIVGDLCAEAGLETSQVDVSALTDEVLGYTRTRRMPARSAIEPLRSAFYFDAVESGSEVRFVKRGAAAVATLGRDDLAAGVDVADTVPVRSERGQEAELPKSVSVAYKSVAADFQTGTQVSRRRVGGTQEQKALELAIVLTDEHAARCAEVALFDAWVGRNVRKLRTWRKWAHLEPTDVIEAQDSRFTYRLRIVDKSEQRGVIELTCRDDDPSVLDTNATAAATYGGGAVVSVVGPTRLELLDIPIGRDADDKSGFYVAASGLLAGWKGGRLYRSLDDGSSFEIFQTLERAATMGVAESALGDYAGGNTIDELNSVDVRILAGGELASVTLNQLLNGGNAALLGDEVLQFKRAELISAGVYRLTGLLRGRLGTEQHMDAHAIDERFVLLQADRLYRPSSDLSLVGRELQYKAATLGEPLDAVGAKGFTDTGAGLKPLSPVHLDVRALPSNAGYSVRWVRRTRIGPNWVDGSDAPVGEASERYRVRVLFGDTVVETQTVTTTSATVGVGQDYTYRTVEVCQLSDAVGPGFPATFQL